MRQGRRHLLFVVNRRSGRGLAKRLAARFDAALTQAGHRVNYADHEAPFDPEACDAAVFFGGDGSVQHAADALIKSDTPAYHVPAGNENLFAREFGMTRDPARLLAALDRWNIVRIDVGRCTDVPFLLMCSMGPDAGVVHRLAAVRRRNLGHLAYTVPVIREILSPSFGPVRVVADGEELVNNEPGLLVIANAAPYGLGINPAVHASPRDGVLDVVFFPCKTIARAVAWLAGSRLRTHVLDRELVYARAESVRVEANGTPVLTQIDGEAGLAMGGEHPQSSVEISLDRARLPVLLPGA